MHTDLTDRPQPPQPTTERPIAVVGATGEQGGAVARRAAFSGVASVFAMASPTPEGGVPAYHADFAATKRLDPQALTFAAWLRTSD